MSLAPLIALIVPSLAPLIAGYVAGSAAAGGVAGGVIGGNVKSAWQGALGGALSGGLTFGGDILTRNWNSFGQIAARSTTAGIYSDIQGGNFADSFKTTLGIETLSYAAVSMRQKMIEQSVLDGRNASGESIGARGGFGFKAGGCRFSVACGPDSAGDVLGGVQGGAGRFFSHRYHAGDVLDHMVETYAGPHDFLNSFMYDAKGNLKEFYGQGVGYWIGQGVSAANVVIATPLAVSSTVQPMLPYVLAVP